MQSNYIFPLTFGPSADVTLAAGVAQTVLTLPADPPFEGVRIVPSGSNVRVAVGRTAVATDPLVISGDTIYVRARPNDIVSVISTGTPVVNAAAYTK